MLTPYEHRQQIELLEHTLAFLRASEPPRCCLNCDLFNAERSTCDRYGDIPIEFQRTPGCPSWTERLPF